MTSGTEISHDLYGATPQEVARRTGSLDQLARIDQFTEEDGKARGARRLRLVTGGGLEADIHPDRALDLGQVTYRGVPMTWVSPTGTTAPALAESRGTEWLRSFGGGLLATCGLDTFGPPSTVDGRDFPMHGRIGATPASLQETSVDAGWLRVRGEVRQASVLGENLVLQRTISAEIGDSRLTVEDRVTNQGLDPAGHMVLYHVNLGWPLLSERAHLEISSSKVTPRDEVAAAGVARWHELEPPQEGFREQVFLHDVTHTTEAVAGIDNPELGISFTLRFDTTALPALHQWKMAGVGHYVMGLEPANTAHIQGRRSAQETGSLPLLGAGESITYRMSFEFGPARREQP
ncbi:aldose 1-epimerase family protein [Nesterenkonia sp.]|uniref:aldose 1-epimerase family protein n=1 Tax=Nesterenkonia sp. TaxID=704201 RepID=UPI00261B49A1|nr:aldose 1-epimerase family protein [Nesterenkonia sp.]